MIETKKLIKIYNPGKFEVKAVNDVSTVFAEGEFTAVVGPSGSGKSTIVQMLNRFYEPSNPENGQICFDGINVKDFKLNDLRKTVGLIG